MRENDREIRRSPLGIDYRTLRGVAGFSLQESDTGDGDGDGDVWCWRDGTLNVVKGVAF